MIQPGFHYPIFGPEIRCPHCRQVIQALTLTDTYLCSRHGPFEADPKTEELVHLQSGRLWRQWQGEWYRQHTHPDGIRFEIHDALDRLYTQGYRATKVVIAQRYQELFTHYLERNTPWRGPSEPHMLRLFGLPIEFSPTPAEDPRWDVINFDLAKEPGTPIRPPYFRMFD
ncbi:TIGR02652 family protein [Candidatus Synechococcus calcipolaris G9]|uniref:TIGR02652 family protein n=1 Tax=Candidatus Synechococcus calcipolaris G9 TaxID=1497997 RepID=A0ABT6F260_9SYNE|nr:TIGR02652 family protein [Candidatus Synechococcus calcipolaris]MDG2991941.1 TIGR02652 family protein [Candidatus Synechococcus calcipolaris G9]